MTAAAPLTVGQTLWYVPSWGGSARERLVTVEKIGRKWAYLAESRQRIDIGTLETDVNGLPPLGRCWLSESDHKAHVALTRLWQDFASRISFATPPDGITEQTIREIAAKLGIKLGDGL